jgi:hypothetical protein
MPDSSSVPVRDGRAPIGRTALATGTIVSIVVAFVFRFLTIEFTNDHFVHLSRGWQILQGDVPIRDFFDPGLTLQYYASAAALLWSGHNLLGEAILTSAFIAFGTGFTFLAAAWLSGSIGIASLATLIAMLSAPRLYGYPKVFFYVLAIVVAWRYAQRPDTRRTIELALVTAVAFLFRHDHGVYIGVAVLALMGLLHWDQPAQGARALVRYGAITLVLLAPFLFFVQVTTGLFNYVGGIAPQVDRVTSVQFNALPIAIDSSAPLVVIAPPADRRVNVRWVDNITDETRKGLEARHGLLKPEHVDDATWSYVLASEDREAIARLVDDPAVADTHGIDRAAHTVDISEPLYVRVQRAIPLLRMEIAPGVFNRDNALAWFYYVTFAVPLISLGLLAWVLWNGTASRTEAAVAAMATVLALVIVQTLVRGSPDSRLADVANPICVIGAWVSARLLRASSRMQRPLALVTRSAVVGTVLLTLWSVIADARGLTTLQVSGVWGGPMAMWGRMNFVIERLTMRPIDIWGRDEPGIPGLSRYVFECTAPTDRVFVTWFAPQIFFYTERPFAGGQVYLTANWHASLADQQLTIERLSHQRVPLVLERVDGEYAIRFPLIYEYVQSHYKSVPMTSDGMKLFRVLVDPHRSPKGVYEPLGLPCYH